MTRPGPAKTAIRPALRTRQRGTVREKGITGIQPMIPWQAAVNKQC
jgi:hypothetical protein